MNKKLYMNSIQLTGKNAPSWNGIPDEVWQTILSGFFFKLAESFGFLKVLEKKDLFPRGLTFFNDWELEEVGLVEFDKEIACRFKLNETCKQKLLEGNFSVHDKGKIVDYSLRDEENYYYEFDELYFFSSDRLIGTLVNHESTIEFTNLNDKELSLLNELDKLITNDIIDSVVYYKAIDDKLKKVI